MTRATHTLSKGRLVRKLAADLAGENVQDGIFDKVFRQLWEAFVNRKNQQRLNIIR
jgi:hypothetical protein